MIPTLILQDCLINNTQCQLSILYPHGNAVHVCCKKTHIVYHQALWRAGWRAMTTATALAGRILKFIENEDVQQDALEVSPASLSLQVLKYVVDTLDGRIAETKFQIENHVVTHEDAFRELIQRSAKIRQGTAEVMHGIEELSRIIDDPEIGLSVQLERALTEKEILNEEYQRVDLSIQLLNLKCLGRVPSVHIGCGLLRGAFYGREIVSFR
ncbi:hypothetical protein BC832DRAFT_5157 [Gaertneriomyces semiglobifer]|nr:hypothetical protein BC832DRAFT_5157 [Gaertneriomyces semiglobifer]